MKTQTPFAELSGGRLLLAAFVIALSNFMVVLDTTIANVSVPHITGNLAVSKHTRNMGRYFICSCRSDLCTFNGLAGRPLWNSTGLYLWFNWLYGLFFPMRFGNIVRNVGVFPYGQGLCGGPLMPLSQTLLMRIFPQEKSMRRQWAYGQ